jgi:hypothetical protein
MSGGSVAYLDKLSSEPGFTFGVVLEPVYTSPAALRLDREYRLLLKKRFWQSTHSQGNIPKKYIN